MPLDTQQCLKNNIHNRSEEDIENCVKTWKTTPSHYLQLDYRPLFDKNQVQGSDEDHGRPLELDTISDDDNDPVSLLKIAPEVRTWRTHSFICLQEKDEDVDGDGDVDDGANEVRFWNDVPKTTISSQKHKFCEFVFHFLSKRFFHSNFSFQTFFPLPFFEIHQNVSSRK